MPNTAAIVVKHSSCASVESPQLAMALGSAPFFAALGGALIFIVGAFGFNDLKQPRVSGLCTLVTATSCTPIPTPEPGSLALVGAGLLGLVLVRRKH